MVWTAAVLLLWWWPAAAGGARRAALDVPRCCPAGEALPAAALRADLLPAARLPAACRPADAAPWAPLVYSPVLANFLDRGLLPRHWRLAFSHVPACQLLRILPEHAAPYALHANGSLLMRGATLALPPERYCADAVAALVCAEDAGGRGPSKCCAEGRAFNGSHCVEDETRALEALNELREIANGSAVGAGWPACADGSQYAVAGALSGSRLLAGGALELGAERRLEAGAWCAEAVAGERGARVLACEHAARAARPAQTARQALYGAGLAVGAAFLAATLAAGFALPAAHHALHWRCQTHYVAALMLGDVLLAATQLAGDRVPPALCRALGEHPQPRAASSDVLPGVHY